jgi:hypothetical protein
LVEDLLTKTDLVLLNDKSVTYLHPASGAQTSIDLSLCDPTLALDLSWKVKTDSHGSDHFPVVIGLEKPAGDQTPRRWILQRADWDEYSRMCAAQLAFNSFIDDNDPVESFSSVLVDIANGCIPKSTGKPRRISKPWFNQECKDKIALREEAISALKSNINDTNISNARVARATARRTIRQSKRQSWQNYVSRINSQTSSKKVWNMIRKISGKYIPASTTHLTKNGSTITDRKDIANTLAETMSHNSSSGHYSEKFQRFKIKAEQTVLNFRSDNTENYNLAFSIDELRESLEQAHNTAVGPDEIHYELLRKLPECAMHTLLNIFNNIWETGHFPANWHLATVIPIPKPGKDHSDPSNYRPIALTSCLCKTQ